MLQDRIVFLDQGGAPDGAASGRRQVDPESGEMVYAAETEGLGLRFLIREREASTR